MTRTQRSRDAERSRDALLDAGERLFSEHGFAATSLREIGAAAGLSRGTPNYFFGSKEHLYIAVLERMFAAREQSVREAFAPVHRWVEGSAGLNALRRVLAQAAEAYMVFLLGRPGFVRFLVWEELAGGERLRETQRDSVAVEQAFTALRNAGTDRGLRVFDVDEAQLVFIEMTFAPLSQRSTFMAALGRDLADAAVRKKHVRFAVELLMAVLAEPAAGAMRK